MPRKSTAKKARRKLAGNALVAAKLHVSDEAYKVGPGRPPREFQFKPGQSGNPKGARRKATSIAPDLKAHLKRALSGKVAIMEGERERFVSKAAAGIERLVNAFAEGDRHARRDVIDLARRLGVDLTAGHGQAIDKALEPIAAEDEALVADFLRRNQPDRDGDDLDHSSPPSDQTEAPDHNEDGE